MKPLMKIFADARPRFREGGRYARWGPLFEAMDSFLFGSGDTSDSGPHVRDAVDFKRIMITVVIALIPCTVMAVWNTGFQANQTLASLGQPLPPGWRGQVMGAVGCDPARTLSNLVHGALYFLPLYLVVLTAGGIAEALFCLVRGHDLSEAFLVTSLLFVLTLPPTVPLWQAALGIIFGVVFAKEVFGGVGKNFMNPALTARAFIYFAYPAQMSGDRIWTAVDGITRATPLGTLAAADPTHPLQGLGITWSQAFFGTIPGSMGETSVLACLVGAAILLITGIASWRVMASMLAGGVLISLFFWLQPPAANPLAAVPPYWHLVLGGFAFGLVFMATDPVTSAQTAVGQWLYGGITGTLAMLIRIANPAFPEGVMLAILLGNVFAPLIDACVIQANIRRRRRHHGL